GRPAPFLRRRGRSALPARLPLPRRRAHEPDHLGHGHHHTADGECRARGRGRRCARCPVRRAPRDRPGLGRESDVLPRLRHELRRAPRGLRRQASDPANPGLGRFAIGLGSGGNPKSFPAFGTSFDERREVFADKLATLRTLVSGGSLPTDHLLYPEAGTANPDRPGLDRRLWQATFSSGGAGAAGAAGDGLMLSRAQPRPQDDPGAALDEVQLPVIDTYLSQLPDDVAPRILASRTAVVADAADL